MTERPSPLAQAIDALYAVRDTIAEHLGSARAQELGLWVERSSHADAIEVRWPGGGSAITRSAWEQGTWREPLRAKLDALNAAAPTPDAPATPHSADPGPKQEGRD